MFYMFFADGFEEVEAIAALDVIRRAGIDIESIGIGSKEITGSHGITVICDKEDSDIITSDDLEGIILPGGMPGTMGLINSNVVDSFIDYCVSKDLLICAICAAPMILGRKGILDGRNAVCFPGFEDELKGATISDEYVCTDGKIITAKACGVALKFGKVIAEQFIGKEKADALWESLYND